MDNLETRLNIIMYKFAHHSFPLTIKPIVTIMKPKLLNLLLLLLFWNGVNAQNIRVSGKVSSKDNGLPLPGVNVVVSGSTTLMVSLILT